jgi:hypothetical protein
MFLFVDALEQALLVDSVLLPSSNRKEATIDTHIVE